MNVQYSKKEFLKRVKQSDRQVVELFLAAGMSPDTRDKEGATALMCAAGKGDVDIARLLVEHGADVNVKTKRCGTALIWATGGLIDEEEEDHVEVIRFLVEHGADVNVQPRYRGGTLGMTPLMDASHAGNIDVVRFLLEHGANVNAEAHYRRTALMEAVQYAPAEVVRLLLEHGADPNVEMTGPGGTALTLAERMDRPDVVKMLIDAGAKKPER
ncbi:MAG: ankyrin repeat domain-containing protein [Candidatus Abyssubacteria bacterium]